MHCGRWWLGAALAALSISSSLACAHRSGVTQPLRVGTSGDYAPFSVDTDGTPTGMDIAVAERLGKDLNRPVALVHVGWPALPAATARGDIDIAMGGVTMRADRAVLGRYTRPYAMVGTVVLVRTSDGRRFATVADLNRPGVRIAVNAGGHLERVAHALFPQAIVQPIDDNREVPRRLLDRRADAVVTDTAEMTSWFRSSMRVIGPLRTDHKAYLLHPTDAALAVQVDQWMIDRENDGWLDAQRARWLGEAARMEPENASRQAVVALVRLRLDLMPAVAAAKRAAGLPIEDRAQEEQVLERVRKQSSRPEHAAAVYRQLIVLAKAVQGAAPAPDGSAQLPALRDALARIDEQLIRELDRAPQTPADQWQTLLTDTIDTPGVAPNDVKRLADALAQGDGAS